MIRYELRHEVSAVGGPLGAAVGWTGGFAADAWRQLHPPTSHYPPDSQ
jgi:hypothetical protein